MVLARVAQPQRKLATAQTLQERFGVDIPLASIYAMMDCLTSPRIDAIKQLATEAATALVPEPVDVLFFDCTTLYFESFEADAKKLGKVMNLPYRIETNRSSSPDRRDLTSGFDRSTTVHREGYVVPKSIANPSKVKGARA